MASKKSRTPARTKTKTVYKYRNRPAKRKTTRRRKKGIKAKISPYIFPATAATAFALPYYNRSKASGVPVVDLLKQDVQGFNGTEAMARVKGKAPVLGVLLVGGQVVKSMKPLPKGLSNIAGDAMLGAGIGTLAKTILDPPEPVTPIAGNKALAPPTMTDRPMLTNNPYDNLAGGY